MSNCNGPQGTNSNPREDVCAAWSERVDKLPGTPHDCDGPDQLDAGPDNDDATAPQQSAAPTHCPKCSRKGPNHYAGCDR